MTTTATTLRPLITLWPDLHAALGDRPIHGAYGLGLRGYLAAIDHHDPVEAAAPRSEERDPAQLGDRPVPLNLAIYDTMRAIEAGLAHCAEVTAAAAVQIECIPLPGRDWPAADRARRAVAPRSHRAAPRPVPAPHRSAGGPHRHGRPRRPGPRADHPRHRRRPEHGARAKAPLPVRRPN